MSIEISAIQIGSRVSYEDMANPRRKGTVVDFQTVSASFGASALQICILWDSEDEYDPSEIAWSDLRQHGWRLEPKDLDEELAGPSIEESSEAFNRRWIEHKNDFGRLEAEQEAAAFLSDPDYRAGEEGR